MGGASTGYNSQTLYALSEDGQTVTVVNLGQPAEAAAGAEAGASEDALAAEEGHLYAVTSDELVVLDSETLEKKDRRDRGAWPHPGGREPRLRGRTLRPGRGGGEGAYVSLEGEPYVLLVEKP